MILLKTEVVKNNGMIYQCQIFTLNDSLRNVPMFKKSLYLMYSKGSAFPALWSRPSESHIMWKTLHVSESHKPYAGLCLKEQTVLQLRVFVQLARRGRTELAKCKIPFSPCHHSTLPCQLFLRHSLSAISTKKQDTGKFHCWKADHILYSASPCHDAPYKISNVVFSTFGI